MGFKVKIGGRTMALPSGEHDIGRMSDCWLTLDDELASRYHARFAVKDGSLAIRDLDSRNGTYVNGERIEGSVELRDGDRVRIGRELIAIIASDGRLEDDAMRQTLAPGEDSRFSSLVGQLVDKSLKAGKLKEAERYAVALGSQLAATPVPVEHPTAQAMINCLLGLAERSNAGSFIDRLFRLFADQQWIMQRADLERVRAALDRIPRIPGTGISDYEKVLRARAADGLVLPDGLTESIAELADSYGGG